MLFHLTPSQAATKDSDEKYRKRLNLLLHPLDAAHPMKLLINKVKGRRERLERELEKKRELEREREQRRKRAREREREQRMLEGMMRELSGLRNYSYN